MSGFSNVGKHLAEGLEKLGHYVSMTGFQTSYESEYWNGIEVMPLNIQYTDDLSQFIINAQKNDSEAVICIFNGDDYEQNRFAKAVKPTFWYCPVEGRGISDMMANDLNFVSQTGKIIAQCNWGQNEMKKAGVESTVIYHGYDPKVFRKISKPDISVINEKVNVLRYADGKWNELNTNIGNLKKEFTGKFIFGFTGANHGIRKRIERLITAYSRLLEGYKQLKDRTLLVLRTMPFSVTGINLIKICSKLEVSSNIVFLYGENNRLTDNAMNAIYNNFDVNVSASSSEGFGLTCLETMAIGIPQLGPSCSSFVELIGNGTGNTSRGLTAAKGEWQMIQDGSYRFVVNEYDLADGMRVMYRFGDEDMEFFSRNAKEFAKQYTWENVIKEWDNLLTNFNNKMI